MRRGLLRLALDVPQRGPLQKVGKYWTRGNFPILFRHHSGQLSNPQGIAIVSRTEWDQSEASSRVSIFASGQEAGSVRLTTSMVAYQLR